MNLGKPWRERGQILSWNLLGQDCPFVIGGVPYVSPSITSGSRVLLISQEKEFPETHMRG